MRGLPSTGVSASVSASARLTRAMGDGRRSVVDTYTHNRTHITYTRVSGELRNLNPTR